MISSLEQPGIDQSLSDREQNFMIASVRKFKLDDNIRRVDVSNANLGVAAAIKLHCNIHIYNVISKGDPYRTEVIESGVDQVGVIRDIYKPEGSSFVVVLEFKDQENHENRISSGVFIERE